MENKNDKKSIGSKPLHQDLRRFEWLARLMDAQFRIPGTEIRFGLDALIGLIPGIGDISTFGVSGFMVWIMAHNGAGPIVLTRMVINILIDSIVGAVPIIGDAFDVAFKANMRNLRLMEEHYKPGRYRKNAKVMIIPVLVILLILIIAIIWVVFKIMGWIYSLIF